MGHAPDAKPKHGGRPPLPGDIVRSERVVTFLTKQENEQLVSIATAAGMSVSRACHGLIITGLATASRD